MSSNTMLKQAIIDANALREVALKNAESIVVGKYSNQIKEAVDMMLEQEEEDPLALGGEDPLAMGGEDPMAMGGAEPMVSGLGDEISLAATDGERLCPCPESGEAIEVDFKDLQDMMAKLDAADDEGEEEVEGFAAEEEGMPGPTPDEVLPPDEEEDLSLQEGDLSTKEFEKDVMLELDALLGEDFVSQANQDETAEADQQAAENLKEEEDCKLETTESISRSLHQKNKKVLKENIKLTKTNSKMLTEHKHLLKEQKQLLKENRDLKNLLKKVSGTLEEVNLSNAKLIYTNQVLSGASLNERQKQRIVEAINSADSVEAAKSIFETLQSAVGSSLKTKGAPQSLGEAITRGSATTLRQNKQKATQDPHINRMKKLAGI